MTRLMKLDEINTKADLSLLEYISREKLFGHKMPINWKAYDRWCKSYYVGYITEKYVYDNCLEVKPIDPDWEYLCHMEHSDSHIYDCTYKDKTADVKYCRLNATSTDYLYVRVYYEKTVQKLLHGADLVIGINQNGDICYGSQDDYTTYTDSYGNHYYKFPIKGIIKSPNTNFWDSIK